MQPAPPAAEKLAGRVPTGSGKISDLGVGRARAPSVRPKCGPGVRAQCAGTECVPRVREKRTPSRATTQPSSKCSFGLRNFERCVPRKGRWGPCNRWGRCCWPQPMGSPQPISAEPIGSPRRRARTVAASRYFDPLGVVFYLPRGTRSSSSVRS